LLPTERFHTPHVVRGRLGHVPTAIVLHTTVGGFLSAMTWFADPGSGVSAHYLVGLDGRLGQFVDETDTARHAGRVVRPTATLVIGVNPNLYTIGIEFEDGGDPLGVRRPDDQYRVGARLIRSIASRWAIPLTRERALAHREIRADTECPGNLDVDRLLREARAVQVRNRL
jgi:N-acetylmuramoyl-L-alanine amidase